MAYTKEDLSGLVAKFERSAERQAAATGSPVKLRASERDLLAVAEKVRDLCITAVQGKKDVLQEVFGGTCEEIGRIYGVLDSVELSDMHSGDQRWEGCRKQLDGVKQILEDLGSFKPWTKKSNRPETLEYPALQPRFAPGERVQLDPVVTGAMPSAFAMEGPPLPDNLRLNKSTGVVSGQLKAGVDVEARTYVVVASNANGEAKAELTFCVKEPPPEAVAYAGWPPFLFAGEPISYEAKAGGGLATEWAVSPELPEGLRLNATTGRISGVPRHASPETAYTVTASNAGGAAEVVLSIAIRIAPPVSLAYPNCEQEYPCRAVLYMVPDVELATSGRAAALSMMSHRSSGEGFKFAPERRTLNRQTTNRRRGSVTNVQGARLTRGLLPTGLTFSVAPALPEGLELSEATGVLSGRPQRPAAKQTYTVTAKNEGGEVETELELTIKLLPPGDLSYPDVDEMEEDGEGFFTGDPLSLTPEIEGIISEWVLEGDLAEGLSFNSAMGIIEGIPSEAKTCTVKVTARNEEGESTKEVTFVVRHAPPANLSYPGAQPVYPLLRQFAINPSVEGQIEEFSVAPALPAGVALDPKTGVISGVPTEAVEERAYTVTAKNDSGAVSFELTFSARLLPPTALQYPGIDDLYYYGEQVELEPLVEGGATQWTVEPPLPAGMSLSESSGKISGAPTATAEEASYVVTASNEAGGTSTVLVFKVTAPAPEGFSYPSVCEAYPLGSAVTIEPVLRGGSCGTFAVEPPLPAGLALDPRTGAISGEPTAACDAANYTVTVSNIAGKASAKLRLAVTEAAPSVAQTDSQFATLIENVTDLLELKKMDPSRKRSSGDWMLWMVHRAWLDDPELTIFDFSHIHMPLPHEEPRVAPKLMQALVHNTHIAQLHLDNSNLQKPQGHQLAIALRSNTTLQILGMEGNNLDSASVQDMAEAIRDSPDCNVQQWRFNCQRCCGSHFGRCVEQALAEMMTSNHKIMKLGVSLNDPHWRLVIDQMLIRNNDAYRRMRKAAGGGGAAEKIPAVPMTLGKVLLAEAPEQPAYEVFEEDKPQLNLVRRSLASSKRLPTKEQLQSLARSEGMPLKFSEVAPLLADFRGKLLDAFLERKVSVLDNFNMDFSGTLSAWTVKNEKWLLDVWPAEDKRYAFSADSKQPILEVSESVAQWLLAADSS